MSVLNWNKGWSWKGYGNLIKEGLQADYPLLAANIDRSDITNAYKIHLILKVNIQRNLLFVSLLVKLLSFSWWCT